MKRCLAFAALLMLALSAHAGVQSMLTPASDQSEAIDRVWQIMVWACSTIYLFVLGVLAWAIWRRRRALASEGARHDPMLARALAAWAVLVVGLLTWFVAISFLADRRLHGSGSGDAKPDLEVRITARQWWWQVEYLDHDVSRRFTTANELRLPRDRTARIELRSGDVIHSFWVPALSGKEDLVPGRTNAVWITPRRAGEFRGQCAEFCGLQHAKMALDVQVAEQARFDAWRAQQLQPAPSPSNDRTLHGSEVFQRSACGNCHTIRGTPAGGRTGPDLTHLASRRTLAAGSLPMERDALARWIADPQHPKPGNLMPAVPLAREDADALVDYLMELR
ncbi:cytochrome c oxidase subunit II [Lysobacter auxotrophicus]|uniref:cytochrome-c oxidase n=1 Tax=Lysobacter auxotrophicus TaxID=2992573 RepID=A0ABN6UJJ8_9GAMM|nr:cytochrome c oxidase subunit II [Lysobacter auxotrophicus]BDU16424.1 cytochrome c oxidase subunit II [Lysobacter auxotrophicus]